MTPLDLIKDWLDPLQGKDLLEIGCGKGALSAPITAQGARWTGLDPFGPLDVPSIVRAGAETMPFDDRSFDAAICVNALHHVPVPLMAAALRETRRILRPRARLVVIEPQAQGELSRVLAVIDDEAEIRTRAQEALDEAVTQGLFAEPDRCVYERTEIFTDFAHFCTIATQVDAARAPLITAHEQALSACFESIAERSATGFALKQPMTARLFERL